MQLAGPLEYSALGRRAANLVNRLPLLALRRLGATTRTSEREAAFPAGPKGPPPDGQVVEGTLRSGISGSFGRRHPTSS